MADSSAFLTGSMTVCQCTSFNSDLSSWDVSNIQNFEAMFQLSAFNGDLSTWNTSSARNMRAMFLSAANFNSDISNWVTDRVTNMELMFAIAVSFNSDISKWDTSKVTKFRYMFAYCYDFNQSLSSWNLQSAEDLANMFLSSTSFRQNLCSWGETLSPAADVTSMFAETACEQTEDPDLGQFPPGPFCFNCTENIISRDNQTVAQPFRCFENSTELFNAVDAYLSEPSGYLTESLYGHPIGKWCIDSVLELDFLFSAGRNPNATDFNEDLSDWDVSSSTSMFAMFEGAQSFNQPLDSWNVSAVTDMSYMFAEAFAFNQPLEKWSVSSVRIFDSMFHYATSFNQTLCRWGALMDVNETTTESMFASTGCPSTSDPDLESNPPGPFCVSCSNVSANIFE